MMIPIHQDKQVAWRWWAISVGKFQKPFFFSIMTHRNNYPWWQRYHAFINLGLCHYIKSNINFQIGLNIGKWYVGLYRHW